MEKSALIWRGGGFQPQTNEPSQVWMDVWGMGCRASPTGPKSGPAPGHASASPGPTVNWALPLPCDCGGNRFSRDRSFCPRLPGLCVFQIKALEGPWSPGPDAQPRPRCDSVTARRRGSPGLARCTLSPLLPPSTPVCGSWQGVSAGPTPGPGSLLRSVLKLRSYSGCEASRCL